MSASPQSPNSGSTTGQGSTMPSANNPAGLDDFVPLSQMNLPEPESSKDKLKRKMIEEPLVPIGVLATTAALLGASNSMRKGDRKTFNHFLRWRVAAQGFTVLAALGGSLYYADERRRRKAADAEAAFRNSPPPMPPKRAPPPTPENQRV